MRFGFLLVSVSFILYLINFFAYRDIGDIWRQVLTEFAEEYPIDWSILAGENCAIDVKMAQEWILISAPSLKFRNIINYSIYYNYFILSEPLRSVLIKSK